MRASKFHLRGSIAFAGVVAALSVASVAWACTYQPRIVGVAPQAAQRSAVVTMSAQGVAAAQAVEVRWNGAEGLKLAEARSDAMGNFSVDVAIPDVAPGVYSLVAVTDGNGIARASFEVTGDRLSTSDARPVAAATAAVFGPGIADVPVNASKTSAGFMAGIALLVIGSAGLLTGSAVAVVRRRRPAAAQID